MEAKCSRSGGEEEKQRDASTLLVQEALFEHFGKDVRGDLGLTPSEEGCHRTGSRVKMNSLQFYAG